MTIQPTSSSTRTDTSFQVNPINPGKEEEVDLDAILESTLGEMVDPNPVQIQQPEKKKEIPLPQQFEDEFDQTFPEEMRLMLEDMARDLREHPEMVRKIMQKMVQEHPEMVRELEDPEMEHTLKTMGEDFTSINEIIIKNPDKQKIVMRLSQRTAELFKKQQVFQQQSTPENAKNLKKAVLMQLSDSFHISPDYLRKQLLGSSSGKQDILSTAQERKEFLDFLEVATTLQKPLIESKEWGVNIDMANICALSHDEDIIEYIVDAMEMISKNDQSEEDMQLKLIDSLPRLEYLKKRCSKDQFENYKKNMVAYLTQEKG